MQKPWKISLNVQTPAAMTKRQSSEELMFLGGSVNEKHRFRPDVREGGPTPQLTSTHIRIA